MSTRSATNKRTQSHEVTGVARKSAASAKPARQAASSVRVVPASSKARRKELEKGENLEGLSKEEKRARKAKQRAREDRIYTVSNILLKQDEDYTKRRRIWWAVARHRHGTRRGNLGFALLRSRRHGVQPRPDGRHRFVLCHHSG